jgi:phosphoglycolate phosphatase-like HAD superfamily hydrolase
MPSVVDRILVLWDVDHTLIETHGVGNELYRAAFEAVTGRSLEREPEITGRTERAILAETLRLHRIEPTQDHQTRYAAALAQQYEQHIDELRERGRVLPGAAGALQAVARVPGVVQTVLSGNLRAVARTKLRAFRLDDLLDLDIGAYGDDEEDRPRLVAVAQRLAGGKYHGPFDRTNTVIIGDSPSDVQTGLDGGATVIGIASGKTSRDQLLHAGADAALEDLHDATTVAGTVRSVVTGN